MTKPRPPYSLVTFGGGDPKVTFRNFFFWRFLRGLVWMGLEGIFPFSSLFCAFLRFFCGDLPLFGAFLRFLALCPRTRANNCNLRRFHRTTEAIPRRPWKAEPFFASRPIKISIKKGTRGVRTRYDTVLLPFISTVRCPGRPVIPVPDLLL